MTNYESVLIARQDLGASQVNSIVEDLSNVIKKEGGEVVRVDNCCNIQTILSSTKEEGGKEISEEKGSKGI